MTIRLAFAGTGSINKVHARIAKAIDSVTLCAVVNHKTGSMQAFAREFGISRQYLSVEELLSDGEVDALVIGTPNAFHAQQAIAALNAGVHVLVEKPMAINAMEAAEMVKSAEENGSLLMVAHCWRFEPQVRWLKKQLKSNAVGKIVRTKSTNMHVHWGPEGWFNQKGLSGGGALIDLGVHAIDTIRFLMDNPLPVSVYAKVGTYYGDYDVDDTAMMMVEWDNGVQSLIESGWWQPHSEGASISCEVFGSEGYTRIFPPFIQHGDDLFQPALTPGADFNEMYEVQMGTFIESVRLGVKPTPGGRQGMINMRIIDAAYQSAQSGRVVAFQKDHLLE